LPASTLLHKYAPCKTTKYNVFIAVLQLFASVVCSFLLHIIEAVILVGVSLALPDKMAIFPVVSLCFVIPDELFTSHGLIYPWLAEQSVVVCYWSLCQHRHLGYARVT